MNKGFAPILVLIIVAIAIAIGGGVFYYSHVIKSQPVACTTEAKQCPDGSYVGRTGPSCEFTLCPSEALCAGGACPATTSTPIVCKDELEGQPVITSLSSNYGPVGTNLEINGCNFSGFEGDKNAWIKNKDGLSGLIYGEGGSTSKSIKIILKSPLCQKDTSYSGLACDTWLSLTPGNYKIYVDPWGKKSNEVAFTILPASNPAPTGTLAGKVSIGPNCPVEQLGHPCPPSPEAYATREFLVLNSSQKQVASFHADANGNYSISLPVGTYTVVSAQTGIGFMSKDLPATITIYANQTTTLNIDVDTGIR